jgi:predicted amino acid racemase
MAAPRCEIDLSKIRHNAGKIRELFLSKDISITAVTKGVAGSPPVANALVESGVRSLGDSHLANIRKMKTAGIEAEFLLTRTPMLSEAEEVAAYVREAEHKRQA